MMYVQEEIGGCLYILYFDIPGFFFYRFFYSNISSLIYVVCQKHQTQEQLAKDGNGLYNACLGQNEQTKHVICREK